MEELFEALKQAMLALRAENKQQALSLADSQRALKELQALLDAARARLDTIATETRLAVVKEYGVADSAEAQAAAIQRLLEAARTQTRESVLREFGLDKKLALADAQRRLANAEKERTAAADALAVILSPPPEPTAEPAPTPA